MLDTENAREVATWSSELKPAPIVEMAGRAERFRPCARRDICRSLLCQTKLCQTNRTDLHCLGGRKGN
jgi:hypothetical protein